VAARSLSLASFSENTAARWELKLTARRPRSCSTSAPDKDTTATGDVVTGSTTQTGFNAAYDAATDRLLIVRNDATAFAPTLIETLRAQVTATVNNSASAQ
jgi:hypothetical protein